MEFLFDPPLSDNLRDEMAALWVEVVNAGGAVVFGSPPVSFAEAAPEVEAVFASAGNRLLVVRLGGKVVGWVVIEHFSDSIIRHRATVKRLMVSTGMRGKGIGAGIMHKVHDVARCELGVSLLWLTCRGNIGLEDFYSRLGYTEMGRLPRALRIAPDDYRDEIFMYAELD